MEQDRAPAVLPHYRELAGRPLIDHETVVQLIGSVRTTTGLTVKAKLDTRAYGAWGESPGSLKATRILDGCASMEFFEGVYRGQPIKAVGLSAFNRTSGCWEHTWTDTLEPGDFHVRRGRFEGGRIDLYGEWTDRAGVRVLSRLTWSEITDDTAHWESHRSHRRRCQLDEALGSGLLSAPWQVARGIAAWTDISSRL